MFNPTIDVCVLALNLCVNYINVVFVFQETFTLHKDTGSTSGNSQTNVVIYSGCLVDGWEICARRGLSFI